MAYTTINKSTDHFNTVTYTGNGTDNHAITGVGFQPDWTWVKNRDTTASHLLCDVLTGVGKRLRSDTDGTLSNQADGLKSFDSDGFTTGTTGSINGNGNSHVAWNWKANGQGSANSDGTITTTYTSANTTAGFSIVTYTGNGTSGATVGHGLGTVPHMIIVKRLDTTGSWQVYHQGAIDTSGDPWTDYMILNLTNAAQDGVNRWNDTAPTTSVFSLGNSTEVNGNGATYVAFVFSEKTGFSKFGKFSGTTGEEFVYTGFKPAFVMLKRTNTTSDWYMFDNKRNSFNLSTKALDANTTDTEATYGSGLDLLSNGFVDRSFLADNGNELIYMAFGQSLVGSNNVPCTAR